LLYVRGTGADPVSRDFGKGAEASRFGFQIVYPERRFSEEPAEFKRRDSRDARIQEIRAVLDDLVRRGTREVLVLAESEGTMLAPELLVQYPSLIIGFVSLSGSVMPFENDLIWLAEQGRGPWAGRQDALREQLEAIHQSPTDIERMFWGHTYRFWASYLRYDPRGHLRRARCPVLYINGEHDMVNLPQQRVIVEQLREAGVDMQQVILPGAGHRLGEMGREVTDIVLDWARERSLIS
jgi:pimeloyl-ACP methyl ester carboxylesterase